MGTTVPMVCGVCAGLCDAAHLHASANETHACIHYCTDTCMHTSTHACMLCSQHAHMMHVVILACMHAYTCVYFIATVSNQPVSPLNSNRGPNNCDTNRLHTAAPNLCIGAHCSANLATSDWMLSWSMVPCGAGSAMGHEEVCSFAQVWRHSCAL